MACDLQMTYGGNTKMKTSSKILELDGDVCKALFNCDKALLGFSGNAGSWGMVVGWLSNPEGKPPKVKDIEFLMLTSDKKIMHSNNLTSWVGLKDKYFAIGSGGAYALGAMEMGVSPKEAVAVACKRDVFSGMGVKSYSI
jgi:hypothetical protein